MTNRKYCLALCDIFHPEVHGYCENDSSESIYGHYITIHSFKYGSDGSDGSDGSRDSDYGGDYDSDDDDEESIFKDIMYLYQAKYNLHSSAEMSHSIVRNYNVIISKPDYIKPEIVEKIILPSNESICILKTFWLRIVQRTWKKIFNKKKQIIQKRMLPQSLYLRQVTGKWSADCFKLPSIRGMI